jgi:iron-sulfur cluster repair protein YtfE (RIC family)
VLIKRRNQKLLPLTHDHHHVLALVRRLRAALKVDGLMDNEFDELLEFYKADMIDHFREEEEQVFPLLVDAQGRIPDELARAIREHLHIHALVRQLARLRSVSVLEELLDVIEGHVRLEERKLFPMVEEQEPLELENVELAPRDRSASKSVNG